LQHTPAHWSVNFIIFNQTRLTTGEYFFNVLLLTQNYFHKVTPSVYFTTAV